MKQNKADARVLGDTNAVLKVHMSNCPNNAFLSASSTADNKAVPMIIDSYLM